MARFKAVSPDTENQLYQMFENQTGRILVADVFEYLELDNNYRQHTKIVGYHMKVMGWIRVMVKVPGTLDKNKMAYVRGTTFDQKKQWLALDRNSQTIVEQPPVYVPVD